MLAGYCPVSQLPYLSKVVERGIKEQVLCHLESNSLIDSCLSAYHNFHSCETVLISVLNTAFDALDNNKLFLLELCDLSAAFDTVDFEIMAFYLHLCGIISSAQSWIMSYLTNWQQMVSVNNAKSTVKLTTYGIPQGSVLFYL
jgi:hypothetical protein